MPLPSPKAPLRARPDPMHTDELAAWLRLTMTPGIGNGHARRLLAAFGLPQAIFEQSSAALSSLLGPALAQALCQPPPELPALLNATRQWLADSGREGVGHALITLGDARYPASLLTTEDPPLMLYALGQTSLLDAPATGWPDRALALVGSRNPTPQGLQNAHSFAQAFGGAGICVVSGLALGIDAAAHEGALSAVDESAPATRLVTVAVIGTGADRVYPRQHRTLAHRIARHGLILSEYPLGTPPLPGNFPKRNRLIAGLSQGTLVVEAALQSGSLITARLAVEQGREVFAIPGSIHSPQSRGAHALIRQGAKLVENAQDVLQELPWPDMHLSAPIGKTASKKRKATPARTSLPPAASAAPAAVAASGEHPLLQALGGDPVDLDTLQARTGLDTPSLQAQLLELELQGQVGRLPGGLYQRLALG